MIDIVLKQGWICDGHMYKLPIIDFEYHLLNVR